MRGSAPSCDRREQERQNAIRHGLSAETVIDALEGAEDYAAFEMATLEPSTRGIVGIT